MGTLSKLELRHFCRTQVLETACSPPSEITNLADVDVEVDDQDEDSIERKEDESIDNYGIVVGLQAAELLLEKSWT